MKKKYEFVYGQVFGRLTAIEEVRVESKRPRGKTERAFRVVCACGNEIAVHAYRLFSGNTESCGCLHRDKVADIGRGNRIHESKTKAAVFWRKAHPEKAFAHDAVRLAIKRGDLVRQPCEVCGAATKIHAHHDDYAKPLQVNWLCRTHHDERHAMLRKMKKVLA